MGLQEIIDNKKISKYKLSKQSGVPYSTICDICTGKSDIRKSSAETVARIAHVLEMDITELLGEFDYPEIKEAKKKSDKSSDTKSVKAAKKSPSKKEKAKSKENKNFAETNIDRHSKRRAAINPDAKAEYEQKKEEAYKAYCKDLEDKKNAMGELAFLVAYLKNNEVEILYNLNRKRESKYLLKIVDELCVKYNFPLCKEYDEIRADGDI